MEESEVAGVCSDFGATVAGDTCTEGVGFSVDEGSRDSSRSSNSKTPTKMVLGTLCTSNCRYCLLLHSEYRKRLRSNNLGNIKYCITSFLESVRTVNGTCTGKKEAANLHNVHVNHHLFGLGPSEPSDFLAMKKLIGVNNIVERNKLLDEASRSNEPRDNPNRVHLPLNTNYYDIDNKEEEVQR